MNVASGLAALAGLVLSAVPAGAVVKIPASERTLQADWAGTEFGIISRVYNGFVDEKLAKGLAGSILFTLDRVTNDGRTWQFTAEVTNLSTAPFTSARISGFGFSTNATIVNKGVTTQSGTFDNGVFSNDGLNINQLDKDVQVCFTAGSNCTGGGGGGLRMGNPFPTTSQVFTLTFTESLKSLSLFNFVMRYQSLDRVKSDDGPALSGASGSGFGVCPNTVVSARGTGTFAASSFAITPCPTGGPVPEPASWAMLIAGFGLIGATMRRRRALAA